MSQNGLPMLLAGIGIGVAATLVLMDDDLRSRMGKALGTGSERVTDALSNSQRTMRDAADKFSTDQLKSGIDDAAAAAKKMVNEVADRSRDAAHRAGEQLEQGGKRLQNV